MAERNRGLIAAVHTPFFTDGRLNLDAVAAQADLMLRAGVAGVFVAGTTGESHSLTVEERMLLATRWVDAAAGTPLRVIIHVGHNCLADAVALARHAAQIGCDGIAALAPMYFKPPSVDELVACCAAIAGAAPELPFYYYHIPSMTGLTHGMPQFLEQARQQIANLAGLKYSSSDLVQLQECLAVGGDELEYFFGSDEMLLAAVALGVESAVGSTYNFAAPLYHQMLAAWHAGDQATARQLQRKSVELVRTLAAYGFPAASKAALRLLGVDCGPVRLPLANLSEQAEAELVARLEALDVLGPRATMSPAATSAAGEPPLQSAQA